MNSPALTQDSPGGTGVCVGDGIILLGGETAEQLEAKPGTRRVQGNLSESSRVLEKLQECVELHVEGLSCWAGGLLAEGALLAGMSKQLSHCCHQYLRETSSSLSRGAEAGYRYF